MLHAATRSLLGLVDAEMAKLESDADFRAGSDPAPHSLLRLQQGSAFGGERMMRTRAAGSVKCSLVFALGLVSLGAGCGPEGEMEPPVVLVAPVERRAVATTFEWPAQLEPARITEVRPRLRGHLAAVHFAGGDRVGVGQLLFTIDDRPYRAALRAAEAQAERARADGPEAEAGDAPDAALLRARLALTWTHVTAPAAGFAAPPRYPVGTGVGPETVLATVADLDPLVATFELGEDERRRLATDLERHGPALQLVAADGGVHRERARRVRLDGERTLRAEFPNPGATLRPGDPVRVRLRAAVGEEALVVPRRALHEGPEGAVARVVAAGGVVETRRVTLGERVGDLVGIAAGLAAGERVVVGGAAGLPDGAAVTPAGLDAD